MSTNASSSDDPPRSEGRSHEHRPDAGVSADETAFHRTNASEPEPTSDEPEAHILLVDDDTNVRYADTIRLERSGYTVTACASAEDALRRMQADPGTFDLVLSDEAMSEVTGLDLARILNSQGYEIPIVIMTGYSSDLTPANVSAAGVSRVLMKPFDTEELQTTMAEFLD